MAASDREKQKPGRFQRVIIGVKHCGEGTGERDGGQSHPQREETRDEKNDYGLEHKEGQQHR